MSKNDDYDNNHITTSINSSPPDADFCQTKPKSTAWVVGDVLNLDIFGVTARILQVISKTQCNIIYRARIEEHQNTELSPEKCVLMWQQKHSSRQFDIFPCIERPLVGQNVVLKYMSLDNQVSCFSFLNTYTHSSKKKLNPKKLGQNSVLHCRVAMVSLSEINNRQFRR